jgi:hypothetical protein
VALRQAKGISGQGTAGIFEIRKIAICIKKAADLLLRDLRARVEALFSRSASRCARAFGRVEAPAPPHGIETVVLGRTPCGSMAKDESSGPFDYAPMINPGGRVQRRFAQGDRCKRVFADASSRQ